MGPIGGRRGRKGTAWLLRGCEKEAMGRWVWVRREEKKRALHDVAWYRSSPSPVSSQGHDSGMLEKKVEMKTREEEMSMEEEGALRGMGSRKY